MANGFSFLSPTVKFREIVLTPQAASLGITILGLVGETQKGPAFQPTFITNPTAFSTYFGSQTNEKLGTSLKYTLPYHANSYLKEGNQLWVTRVLGLSGYNAGTGWALKVNAGLDTTTTAVTNTTTATTTFSGGSFLGISINTTGIYTTTTPYVKAGTTFTATGYTLNVTSYNTNALTGNTTYSAQTITGSSLTAYENMVVAVVRSRGLYVNNTLLFNSTATTLSLSGGSSNLLGTFVLTTQGITNESYTCTLDNSSTSYLPNVIGNQPKGKNTGLFVEAIYPDLINVINNAGPYASISPTLVTLSSPVFTNYVTQYQAPITPWVVSNLRGSKMEKMFRFISISDGNSANKEIKISIQRMNFNTNEFDVVIRDFNDTDANITVLESFTRCSMDPSLPNYVGTQIGSMTEGSTDLDNDIQSNYVYLEIAANLDADIMPCGFEGYYFRNYSATNTGSVSAQTPTILYKTGYTQTDKINRVYLGVSERAYDTLTNGTGINQNLFNFIGTTDTNSSLFKTNGFHMDSGATGTYIDGDYVIGSFTTGVAQLQTALDTLSGPYSNITALKFTVVPYGGFDGWDVNQSQRTNTAPYVVGRTHYIQGNDYDAYLAGINTFINPEETPITLFATPGLNWYDHTDLVNETIDLIEVVRMGDALYVIDSPDMLSTDMAQDLVDKLTSVDIDSNYSCTYAPWIQIYDTDSGVNQYIPPAGEVLRVMAYTDKVAFPWFAPAGVNRGLVPAAKQVRKKFSEPDRDILYPGRINPIAKFNDIGVDIFGQKTLQIQQSALDRINVRRLLIYAKLLIRQIAKNLLFEQDDDTTINDFLGKVNPILSNIQRERGLRNFVVRPSAANTPESQDRNEYYFDIVLTPTSSLEFIGVSFYITPSTVVFNS